MRRVRAGEKPLPAGREGPALAAGAKRNSYPFAGQRVATLWSGDAEAGEHVAHWDGRDASGALRPAGVYFARLTAAGQTRSEKLLRVR